ncbi:Zn-dependent alcohol dehydrogenase [Streptomyces adelaidensis]|uniref:Zn-dependent alcohol dehydrogenase n=1 Tax=Streptomyces adelaidensis TaxID=2796465 RepID=UPI0027DB124F|nr:Zn-dependent alcohol dehydrogenase [Streptomyces adelaidensis]
MLEEFGQPLVIGEIEVDEVAPDEVLVRVIASGLCHTDRSMQLGAQPLPLPLLLGHEASGIVERVGSAVTTLRPGDHVVTCASAFCGECEWCMRGLLQHCESKRRARPTGRPPRLSRSGEPVNVLTGLGAFASHLLVYERTLAKVPTEMPLDRAALLGCAVLTGMGAVRHRARVRPGQSVAVIGCGGVGLNVVQAARFVGAARVIAVDVLPAKLEQARRFGATDVVDASREDPVEAVKALTGGGVDHALEVVGRPATIEQAFAMTRTRGTTTVVGVTRAGETIQLPAEAMMLEKRIQGSKMGSSQFRLDIPLYCRLYLDGRIMLDELVSETIDLADINQGLEKLDGSDGIRSLIAFG